MLPLVALLLCGAAMATGASGGGSVGGAGRRRPFSPAEFQALKQELHTLSSADADRRFAEVQPLSSPPPRQDKVDHMVVLFMRIAPSTTCWAAWSGTSPARTVCRRAG